MSDPASIATGESTAVSPEKAERARRRKTPVPPSPILGKPARMVLDAAEAQGDDPNPSKRKK